MALLAEIFEIEIDETEIEILVQTALFVRDFGQFRK